MELVDIVKFMVGIDGHVLLLYDNGEYSIKTWPDDTIPQPAQDELNNWASKPPVEFIEFFLKNLRQQLRTQAEETFYRLASEKTGEPINALIIQEWQAKEMLVRQWVAEGKPTPTPDNAYALAYYEANGDPIKPPEELMEVWLVNATAWRQLNIAYIAWRQGFRARLKEAKSEEDLGVLRATIEPELRTMLGI